MPGPNEDVEKPQEGSARATLGGPHTLAVATFVEHSPIQEVEFQMSCWPRERFEFFYIFNVRHERRAKGREAAFGTSAQWNTKGLPTFQ